jgi:hypothetical protein
MNELVDIGTYNEANEEQDDFALDGMGNKSYKTLMLLMYTFAVINPYLFVDKDTRPTDKKKRKPNEHRDRQYPIQFICTWSDEMFVRQFRVDRVVHAQLVQSLERVYPINEAMAIRSSGSCIPHFLRLCITLRILAGASYLDIIWYGVDVDNYGVHNLFKDTIMKLDSVIDNINFPISDDAALSQLASDWETVMVKKYGEISRNYMKGTVAACDGLVIGIHNLRKKDLRRLSKADFYNRKGFPAVLVQAFCDAFCRFSYWMCNWPGATNDITAYRQTTPYIKIVNDQEWRDKPYHIVLDLPIVDYNTLSLLRLR